MGKCFEAMEVDSLPSSHPVSTHVENPVQIQEMFDDVSYDKVRTRGTGMYEMGQTMWGGSTPGP